MENKCSLLEAELESSRGRQQEELRITQTIAAENHSLVNYVSSSQESILSLVFYLFSVKFVSEEQQMKLQIDVLLQEKNKLFAEVNEYRSSLAEKNHYVQDLEKKNEENVNNLLTHQKALLFLIYLRRKPLKYKKFLQKKW